MTSSDAKPIVKTWDIPSTLPVVREVVEEVAQALAAADWPDDGVFAVRMGLDEAVANAVKHGNKGDAAKRVGVEMRLHPDRIELKVRDQGEGFDPAAVPDPTCCDFIERPHGRGVMLIHVYMNEVSYAAKGNEVTMVRLRSGGPSGKGGHPGPGCGNPCD